MKKGFVSLRNERNIICIYSRASARLYICRCFYFYRLFNYRFTVRFCFRNYSCIYKYNSNLGPFIGAAPAVIVGLFVSPMQALYVIIIVTIVQQFESNIISPRIMSSKLNIHPLTIIILILGVGNFAGIIGMILAVPVYAVTKTVVSNLVRLFKTKRSNRK